MKILLLPFSYGDHIIVLFLMNFLLLSHVRWIFYNPVRIDLSYYYYDLLMKIFLIAVSSDALLIALFFFKRSSYEDLLIAFYLW